ncbi:MAG: ArsR family transcriptional regulator [Phycisphaerae bacterium]|nr:ArsR family transcriptional regulator [Phycisphaerae bacterium]
MNADLPSVTLFKALGDTTRHLIMQLLSQQEVAVNELVESLGQPQSTISRHLRVLREAGLIADRREGVTVYCRATCAAPDKDPMAHSIHQWFNSQPLPTDVADRLEQVIRRRRLRSSTFFDQRGDEWDDLRCGRFGHEFPLQAFLGLLPEDWVAADLGTGTGHLLPALGRAFSRVIAVDHSEVMLARARQRIGAHALTNVELRQGELEALPIDDAGIDLAIAMLVLHHVGEPARAMSEIARTLRGGGKLLIVELSEHHDDDLQQTMGDLWMGFSSSRLSALAEQAGMRTERVMTLSSAHRGQGATAEEPSLFALIVEKSETR